MLFNRLNRLLDRMWRVLPDKCSILNCPRRGVRGNENIVTIRGLRIRMCDYCASTYNSTKE